AVARCAIRSRRRDADAGHEVRCAGSTISAVMPCGCPPGTQVEVRELFFNTPARRRFLRSAGAAKAEVQELLGDLLLPRLDVGLTLVADGAEVLRLPAGQTLAERFASCQGRELARGLLPVDRQFPGLRIAGVAAEPDLARR